MNLFALTSILALVWACCNAASLPKPYRSHEKRTTSDPFWSKTDRVDGDAVLPLRIGLVQDNLENGYEHLMSVSHPASPNFGKHWTAEEVHDMFAPSSEAVAAVRGWLEASGVHPSKIVHSDNKGWLALDIPARHAETIFRTRYYEHEHSSSGNIRIGCDEYYLPQHIQQYVDYITPGVKLSPAVKKVSQKRAMLRPRWNNAGAQIGSRGPSAQWQSWSPSPSATQSSASTNSAPSPTATQLPADLLDCGRNVTPACIKFLYSIPDAHLSSPGNSLGLYEGGDYYSQADINLFFAQYAPYVPQGTAPIPAFIDGAHAPVAQDDPTNTGESDIDIDMAYSLIYPQTVTLYQTDDPIAAIEEMNGTYEGFLNNFLDALDGSYCTYSAYNITGNSPGIDAPYPDPAPGGYKGQLQCGVYTPTKVISVSYGEAEYDLPENYVKRQCNEFLKLGLQGHSIFIASGDYGVATFPTDLDVTSGCLGANQTVFAPQYPGGCPYLTSVGATQINYGESILVPESALEFFLSDYNFTISSSGGFSNYFTVPSYQESAVSSYFANHDPGYPCYVYNGNSSLGADGGLYNCDGRGYPDVSANGAHYRAYLNGTDQHWYGTSLASPLWASIITLINEERYEVGKGPVGFINPTLYANPWVFNDIVNGSNPGCGTQGFSAVEGWDPITGLGTPQYPKLLQLFMSMP